MVTMIAAWTSPCWVHSPRIPRSAGGTASDGSPDRGVPLSLVKRVPDRPDEAEGEESGTDGSMRPGEAADALLFASAPSADGGPAAALPMQGGTVIGRLLGQLETLGIRRVWLLTRPEWRATLEASAAGATVVASDDLATDLRQAAEIFREVSAPLLIGNAHVVTQREALAGLLGDPRIASGVVTACSSANAEWAFPLRAKPAQVMSASSAYHAVTGATDYFVGLIKVDPVDRDRLVAASTELAGLATDPFPVEWIEEARRKADSWRDRLGPEGADEAELALRRRASADDAAALLLVGLVRQGAHLFPQDVNPFFHAAPLTRRAAESAAAGVRGQDEDRALLEAALKTNDSAFTTFLVSPYSKYLARFAARRGFTPNQVTVLSLIIGLGAAVSFAIGSRAGLVAGAVLLQVSFTVDCVDGQLARYTRTFSTLGGWLDSVFDRLKEYAVYGGLAVGATRGFGDDVWLLAACALALQTVRHLADFAWVASRRSDDESAPGTPLDRAADLPPTPALSAQGDGEVRERLPSWLRWGNQLVRLPIGERFALVSLTAAIASPRVTFVVLLAWGGVAAVYSLAVRVVLSTAERPRLLGLVLK
jgi:hypothetical protein